MKKIMLIDPYFGTLPREWFQVILDSCRNNKTINWLLITDDHTRYNYPSNVKVVYEDWTNFAKSIKKLIYDKYGFNCSLDYPFKLCDYRPLYGTIFSEYLEGYDYWGYSDMTDVVYGDLRKFLTNEILTFDKVNYLGHLTLFKNDQKVNDRYSIKLNNGISFKDILRQKDNMAFDEITGQNNIQQIYEENSFSFVLINDMVADVSPLRFAFQLSKFDKNKKQYYEPYRKQVFSLENGHLFCWYLKDGEIHKKEYGYIHLQKRKMNNYTHTINKMLIVPNKFIDYREITRNIISENSRKKLYTPFFKLKLKALKTRLKNRK